MARRTFVVDRSKWRCGGNGKFSKGTGSRTSLRNNEGSMCCLGHTMHQCGVPMDKLTGQGMPSAVSIGYLPSASMFMKKASASKGQITKFAENTVLSSGAAQINDLKGLTLERRERILRKWFNLHGFGLSFVGKSIPNASANGVIEALAKKTDDEILVRVKSDCGYKVA